MGKIKDFFRNEKAVTYTAFITINAAILYALFFLIKNAGSFFSWLHGVLLGLFSAFSPLLIGMVLAYLLSPLVDFVDRKLTRRFFFSHPKDPIQQERLYKKRYLISIFLTIVIVFSALSALIYAFAVLIAGNLRIGTFREMLFVIYNYFTAIQTTITDFIAELPNGSIKSTAASTYHAVHTWLFQSFSDGRVFQLLSQIGSSAVNIALGFVVSIYLLKDKSFFQHLWRKFLHLLLPQKQNAVLTEFLHDIDHVLSMFVRGAVIDALIVALLSSIALSLYGLPLAVFVGCFAGITNIIPYFGPVLGMIPALAVGTLTGGIGFGIGAVIVLFIVQQIDCNLIYPKIVGSTTGLHPLFILLSVSVMGYYGGIAYMILAVPLAGILNMLVIRLAARSL